MPTFVGPNNVVYIKTSDQPWYAELMEGRGGEPGIAFSIYAPAGKSFYQILKYPSEEKAQAAWSKLCDSIGEGYEVVDLRPDKD